MAQLNEQKFHAFIGKMLGDLGGAFSVPTTRIGFRLGLFDALGVGGPATAADLAARAGGLAPRYVREWALAQASNGYIDFDPATDTFAISPEHQEFSASSSNAMAPPMSSGRPMRPMAVCDAGVTQRQDTMAGNLQGFDCIVAARNGDAARSFNLAKC